MLPIFYMMGLRGVVKIVYDEAIHSMNIKIPSVFIKIVETIKAQITPLEEINPADDKDTILTEADAPYDSLLYFLWACQKFQAKVVSLPM